MFLISLCCSAHPVGSAWQGNEWNVKSFSQNMEYILNVRSFFALLCKGVLVKYILRFPHHGNRSFAGVIDDTLPSYTRIMESAVRRSPLVYVVRLIEDTRSP